MRVSDIVFFNREKYYNGAIQTEWFYEKRKLEDISKCYIFHGPKYFGVSSKDIVSSDHRLIDTASFAKVITDKLYGEKKTNEFALTIAGYGTGKSHLAVTLGGLFSGDEKIRKSIISNIQSVDPNIADDIENKISKKNLIIALNGMNNFNLDSEILKCVRTALKNNDLDDSVLHSLTKSYEVAKYFIESNFETNIKSFEEGADSVKIKESGEKLKKYLIDNIESDSKALEIVNFVYKKVTGDTLRWEQGISAGAILKKTSEELCGEGKPFNKILILFDEFGRYIEYVAANPLIAGDASLQQIFEAIQGSNNRIVFLGFIQYELEAYLSHIDKSANVIRYVGRYSSSDKFYLSSNFETILANLLEKKSDSGFETIVDKAIEHYDSFHTKMHSAFLRWSDNKTSKEVWKSDKVYRNVILKGCYPMHPITVWLLSNSSNWMQQRATIAFCSEMYDLISNSEIDGDFLPYIYPINIIDSGIYSEMLNSEEKGLVKSQNCLLYNEIITKLGEKLSENELKVLKAVLICKIASFSFFDKQDALTAIKYCSNLDEDEIKAAIKELEDRHGIIGYDEQSKTYDLIAEANGFNEFKRVFARYKMGSKASIEDLDEDLVEKLKINEPIDSSFAQEMHISSPEWKFKKDLIDSKNIDEGYLLSSIRTIDSAYDCENYRGIALYAYCSEDSDDEVYRLTKLCEKLELMNYPIIVVFLDDSEGEIIRCISVLKTLLRFSLSDTERFYKQIQSQRGVQEKKLIKVFNDLALRRQIITEEGLITFEGRITSLCTTIFKNVYSKVSSFVFDGFDSNKPVQARKSFITVCVKLFDKTLMNIQSYQALSTQDKNRIKSCFATGMPNSWQVFNDQCELIVPQNEAIKRIFDEIDNSIPDEESISVSKLFGKYLHAPYGMNIYSYTFLVLYFIVKQDNKNICMWGNDKLSAAILNNNIFKDSKIRFQELQKVTIKRNLNADIDVIGELCSEILDNSNIEKCVSYRSKLNDELKWNGGDNRVIIGQAFMRLDDGDRLFKDLESRKENVNILIEEAKEKLLLHKFINVFKYIDLNMGVIEEGLPFVFPQSYIDFMREANEKVRSIFEDNYRDSLARLKCSDIMNLGGFKKQYEKIVVLLKENKLNEIAEATEKRSEEVVEETTLRNKYQQTIAECEKDVVLCNNIQGMSLAECNSNRKKFEGWIEFFESKKLPNSVVGSLVASINRLLDEIRENEQRINSEIDELLNKVNSYENAYELIGLKDELKDYLEEDISDEKKKRLVDAIKRIENLENRLNEIPDKLDELYELNIESNLKDNFDLAWSNEIKKWIKKLEELEDEWITEVIIPVEKGEITDAQQCVSWIDKLHKRPEYISEKTFERAELARKNVDKKLHDCKVNGVVSLYNDLTDDEKQEFLRLIRTK